MKTSRCNVRAVCRSFSVGWKSKH